MSCHRSLIGSFFQAPIFPQIGLMFGAWCYLLKASDHIQIQTGLFVNIKKRVPDMMLMKTRKSRQTSAIEMFFFLADAVNILIA